MSRDPIRVGTLEIQISVQPLRDGGFTYTVVEIEHGGARRVESRFDSHLRFETEEEAYEGGAIDARRRAKRVDG